MTDRTPAPSAAIHKRLSATAGPVIAATFRRAVRAVSGFVPYTAPTPKPECLPQSEVERLIAHRNSLHPNHPKRGQMLKAISSARHDALRGGLRK